MNVTARLAQFSLIVVSLVALPLRAQDAEVPRTRTSPGIGSPAFPYAVPEEVSLSSERLARLGDEVTSWVAGGDLVGAELLIVKDGRAVFHEAYGWSDREERRPVERGSIWSIKSMTKPFTATAILMLAEEGKLSLGDPVSQYLPGFAGDERTTIRHLLSHTSGYRGLSGNSQEFDTFGAWVEDWARQEPTQPLGTYTYSDFNYGALGYIVEAVSDESVEGFLQDRLIEPLGLAETHTTFSPDSPWADRVPSRYEWQADAADFRRIWSRTDSLWYPFFPAAWGLWASATDYATFMTMWLNRGQYAGKRLLSEASVEASLSPQSLDWDGGGHYVYGWNVRNAPSDGGMPGLFQHEGYDGTWAMAFPGVNTIVIYLTHSQQGPHFQAFYNRLTMLVDLGFPGKDMVWADKAGVDPAALSEAERGLYVGTYRGRAPGGTPEIVGRVWDEDGHLNTRFGELGQSTDLTFHLVPLGDHRFTHGRYVDGRLDAIETGITVQFLVEDGEATGYELTFDGQPDFSVVRADSAQVEAEIEAVRNRVAIDEVVRERLEAEGVEAARVVHRALLDARPDTVLLGESLLNALGYRLLAEERLAEAIAVLEMNVEAYPASPNVYDSLADAYRAAGQLDEARRSYARAVELAEQAGDARVDNYRARLERARRELEAQ